MRNLTDVKLKKVSVLNWLDLSIAKTQMQWNPKDRNQIESSW